MTDGLLPQDQVRKHNTGVSKCGCVHKCQPYEVYSMGSNHGFYHMGLDWGVVDDVILKK